jgi:hypothetical protein
MALARSLAVLSLLVAACQEVPLDPGDLPGVVARDEGGKADGAAAFRQCLARFTPAPAAGWRHTTSRFIAALGWPVHAASDVVARPGATAPLRAKLAYGGPLSKDLEDEWVWVFVHDCTAWRYVGYAKTDGDGRATFNLSRSLAAGVYDVRFEVVGDATVLPLRLWVLPAGTHLAVVDIDGTLTEDDGEIFEEILFGWEPEPQPAARDLAWVQASRDQLLVYLTGRPEILAAQTRAWLDDLGFPPGVVRLARTAGEVLPTDSGVGAYKAEFLAALRSAGYRLDEAFGNATTDIYAYARAGIPRARTWIIGEHAGEGGTVPVTGGWQPVVEQLALEPQVDQPW